MNLNDIKPYLTELSAKDEAFLRTTFSEALVNNDITIITNKFSWLDCTKWNKEHTYRLRQTIDFTYHKELTLILTAINNFAPEEKKKALYDEVYAIHINNLIYEKDIPPKVYEKKKGIKSSTSRNKLNNNRRTNEKVRATQTVAEQKLAAKAAKLNNLKFKIL